MLHPCGAAKHNVPYLILCTLVGFLMKLLSLLDKALACEMPFGIVSGCSILCRLYGLCVAQHP